MTFRSAQAVLLRWIGYPLFLMAFCALAGLVAVRVQAQPRVNLTLRISITDKVTKDPIKNVEISIPRQGINSKGIPLQEIKATLADGTLVRPDTDFELTGNPHKLIILKAEGFEIGSPTELTDDALRQAALKPDQPYEIPIELAKLSAGNTTGLSTAAGTASPAGTPKVNPQSENISTILTWIGHLNYAFWVLGVAGAGLLGCWFLLVVLTRVFHRDSIEYQRRVLRLAPLLAQGLVWPFGYRLRFSLPYKRELDPPQVCLRSINDSLVRLLDPGTSMSGSKTAIESINENLARLAGLNDGAEGIGEYLDGIKASFEQLSKEKEANKEIQNFDSPKGASLDSLKRASKEAMDEALTEFRRDLLKEFKPDLLIATPASGGGVEAGATLPKSTVIEQIRMVSNDQQKARLLYQRLLDHESLDCKPVYLEADAKSSILGKFADANVYLLQVASPQAPFVLFIDDCGDGTIGWVFPNTAQGFDRSTLKDVFPGLNEAQFNDAKEIQPVGVSKAGERRWKVDREFLVNAE